MTFIHSEYIAHRDIKPANILITKDGNKERYEIADYGVGSNLSYQCRETNKKYQMT